MPLPCPALQNTQIPLPLNLPDAAGEGLLTAPGIIEREDRRELLAAVARFRAAVDEALPGMYVWFSEASLHVTLRALIN